MIKHDSFLQKVAKMRKLQKEYYQHRDPLSLRAAKAAEKDVDADLERIEQKSKQEPKLF